METKDFILMQQSWAFAKVLPKTRKSSCGDTEWTYHLKQLSTMFYLHSMCLIILLQLTKQMHLATIKLPLNQYCYEPMVRIMS